MSAHPVRRKLRRATAIVATVVMLPVLFGFAALAVDVGLMFSVEAQLQRTADAAGLAAVSQLPEESAVYAMAQQFGTLNQPKDGMVIAGDDMTIGNWDPDFRVFSAGLEPFNAVELTVRRAEANGNALPLYFARLLGVKKTDLSATAVAYMESAGKGFRFLLDDEMIDSDVPVIEDLAYDLGIPPDVMISDNNDDLFIDIPPETELELPTGQVGDEALFDVANTGFPFGPNTDPSLVDFLLYDKDGPTYGITDGMLDPLLGVEPVSDPSLYPSFVNPDQIHVSPLYKSDVSNTEPGVNAKGERRGLLAFRIIGIGYDPPGSYLPNIKIQVVDPSEVDLDSLKILTGSSGGGKLMLVR